MTMLEMLKTAIDDERKLLPERWPEYPTLSYEEVIDHFEDGLREHRLTPLTPELEAAVVAFVIEKLREALA